MAITAELTGFDIARSLAAGKISTPMKEVMPFTPGILEEGYAEIHARPEEKFYNPMNVVHGGWSMTMLDTVMGIVAQTTLKPGETYLSYETSVKFFRALRKEDEQVLITGSLINRGRNLIALEASITLPDGKLCAHGTSTCVVLEARPNSREPLRQNSKRGTE